MKKTYSILVVLFVFLSTFIFSGCTLIFQKGRRVDVEKISKLKSELSNLEQAKQQLEDRLKKEIDANEVNVEMLEKGLVITFVAEVLFDSGKAELRKDAPEKLGKIAEVVNTTVKDFNLGVEGHTDNIPIKYSGWKSNWELSSHRALSVLHLLVDEYKVDPRRLSAIGYGEYKPIGDNSIKEGRQKNRRVEIVILPNIEKKRK